MIEKKTIKIMIIIAIAFLVMSIVIKLLLKNNIVSGITYVMGGTIMLAIAFLISMIALLLNIYIKIKVNKNEVK